MDDATDGGTGGELPAWVRSERALQRLQDVLERVPADRALPDLEHLLALADAQPELLDDERARKLLAEAIAHRPLSAVEEVRVVRTEVELLTVEVGVLAERLCDPGLAVDDRRELVERLARIRARLTQLTRLL